MDISLAGFIEYVNKQPADKLIDNSSWSSCAVGEYAYDVHKHDIPVTSIHDVTSYAALRDDPVLTALWADSGTSEIHGIPAEDGVKLCIEPSLMDMLNNGEFGSYGELQCYINESI